MKSNTYQRILQEWTPADTQSARDLGWKIGEVWDKKMFLEVQRVDDPAIFRNDQEAAAYVEKYSKTNLLCSKAHSIVFRSKATQ